MTQVNRPNIVFILSDQHNPNVIGAAGDPVVETKNLDRLWNSGTAFTNVYCASPLCVPSRASLLSGALPSENGVFTNMEALRSDRATFVHGLASAGYETVLAGRMHFNGPDQRHGYTRRLVGDITGSFPGRGDQRRQYGDLKGTPDQSRVAIMNSGGGNSSVLQFDRTVTDATCEYLTDRTNDAPLFLTVGFYGPHCPYVAPEELFRKYYSKVTVPTVAEDYRETVHPAMRSWYHNRNVESLDQEDVRRVRAAYYGMVEYLDGLIGEVIGQVERTLGLKNTLIVYASDHGDNIGEHGLFWKTNFYEGAARVPLIFSMPGIVPGGQTNSFVSSLLDIAPTFLSLGGADGLPVMHGRDIWPTLCEGESGDPDRAVTSQLADLKGDPASAMIRKGPWKLILHHGFDMPQLFNLDEDPDEMTDLGSSDVHSAIRADLLRLLSKRWDPESVTKHLEKARAHANILSKFTKATKLEGFDEWYGLESGNFVSSVKASQ